MAAFEKAGQIAEWISQRDASDTTAAFDVAAAHTRTASSLIELPDAAAALAHLSRAESILSRLAKGDPANQRYRLYALGVDYDSGRALSMLGRAAEASARLERARAEAAGFRGGPNEKTARSWALGAAVLLGQIRASSGDRAAALALANEAAAGFNGGGFFGAAWSRALNYQRLGILYSRVGQRQSSAEWLGKSIDVWRGLTVPAGLEAERGKALAAVEAELANAASRGY